MENFHKLNNSEYKPSSESLSIDLEDAGIVWRLSVFSNSQ